MSVAVLNGRSPVLGGRLFSASRVGLGKSKQFTHLKANVSLGTGISLRMRSHRLTMRGFSCCRVSGVAVIMTVATRSMLSGTKNEKG